MRKFAASLAMVMVAACHRADPANEQRRREVPLERAAIAAGVIPDPLRTNLTGLYIRDTDRICIVPGRRDYRIGVSVVYESGQGCDASGTVQRDGAALHIELSSDCRFDARFDGDAIAFPARLPDACRALCHGRPTLAAITVDQRSDSGSEAASMQDGTGRLPCG